MSSTLPNRPLNVAVLGASGAVGQELLLLLEERRFSVGELKLLASARSAGQTQTWNGRTLTVEEVSAQSLKGSIWCWRRPVVLFLRNGARQSPLQVR